MHGYAANKVATQSPPAGTRVRDTGAPTIIVKLAHTAYPEKGEPEDVSPYVGTPVQPIRLATVTPDTPAPSAAVPAAPTGAEKEKAPAAAATTPAKPAATTPRPPAFVVAKAPKEPLKEMPLQQRAKLLSTWLDSHRKNPANVRHFLYQHSSIVTGASFGWWHGAQALRELIAIDRVAQKRWGIGRKSGSSLAVRSRRSK